MKFLPPFLFPLLGIGVAYVFFFFLGYQSGKNAPDMEYRYYIGYQDALNSPECK